MAGEAPRNRRDLESHSRASGSIIYTDPLRRANWRSHGGNGKGDFPDASHYFGAPPGVTFADTFTRFTSLEAATWILLQIL